MAPSAAETTIAQALGPAIPVRTNVILVLALATMSVKLVDVAQETNPYFPSIKTKLGLVYLPAIEENPVMKNIFVFLAAEQGGLSVMKII